MRQTALTAAPLAFAVLLAACSAAPGAPSLAEEATGATTSLEGITPSSVKPRIALFGGTPDGVTFLGDTWTFDGTAWTQIDVVGPGARSGAAAATLGGKMVVFGGSSGEAADGGTSLLSDTWTFDGAHWARVSTTSHPSARSGAGVGVLGGSMFVFGGGDGRSSYLHDLWKFDGADWTEVKTPAPTPVRDVYGMSATASALVLFGGDTSKGDFLSDTWVFDGASWSHLSLTTSPGARAIPVMQPWNGGILLFGGLDSGGGLLDDTWTFDGSAWTQLDVKGPGGKNDIPGDPNAAVLGSEVVLFSGDNSALTDGTWSFDGTWSPINLTNHPVVPSARVGAAVAALQ